MDTKFVEFKKQDARRQVVLGVVYAPDTLDSHGDYASAETIEKAAYQFLASGRVQALDIEHDGKACGARVVESFLSKGDDDFPSGSWVIGAWCPPDVWGDIETGTLTGFSLTGRGRRVEKSLNGKPAREIQDLEIDGVSLVKKPANKTAFALLKSDDAPPWVRSLVEATAKLARGVAELDKRLDETKAVLAKADARRRGNRPHDVADDVRKAVETEHIAKAAVEKRALVRKLGILNERLYRLWEGDTGGFRNAAERERQILSEISKTEDELAALRGSVDQFGVGDPSRSAFHQRGGQSHRVDASSRVSGDSYFAPRADDKLRKSREDAVDLTSLKI